MESIEQLGAVNVAAEMGKGGLVQVSIEQVLRWNPDVVITIDPNFYAAARSHPLWKELPAIKAGRIYLSPSVPFGWIDFPPSINRLIGLRWLARVLYPKAFPEDLRPIVRDFYTRCYHQTPTEAQLDAAVADRAAGMSLMRACSARAVGSGCGHDCPGGRRVLPSDASRWRRAISRACCGRNSPVDKPASTQRSRPSC